ncbi:PH domain-containing protein [Oleiharenicola sp. Vm1]|uniref:PH domain-containing protein n=1 Tax=Oleiharenicola sp. Vm1 TaxID=3398393 RepID=UPI0039F47E93
MAAMPPEKTFRSRVDAWLVAVVAGATALPIAAAIWLASHGQTHGVLLLGCWGVTMLAVGGALSWPLRYTLRADRLHIQSGWLEWDVPYASLRAVAPSRNPLAAPAWSLRRVRLDFADGFILVSPDDREVFISELAERCPHLVRTGAGLAKHLPLPHEKAAR